MKVKLINYTYEAMNHYLVNTLEFIEGFQNAHRSEAQPKIAK